MASFCEPLRILMKAIASSFSALFWSLVTLAMIEIIAQILADAILDKSVDEKFRQWLPQTNEIDADFGTEFGVALGTEFDAATPPNQRDSRELNMI